MATGERQGGGEAELQEARRPAGRSAAEACPITVRDSTRITRLLDVLGEQAPLDQVLDRALLSLSELFAADVVALLPAPRAARQDAGARLEAPVLPGHALYMRSCRMKPGCLACGNPDAPDRAGRASILATPARASGRTGSTPPGRTP